MISAAALLNVSKRSVSAASYVHDHGCKELKELLSSGEIPVSLAEKFCKEFTDKKEQSKIAKGGIKSIKEAMKGDRTKAPDDAKAAEKAEKDKAKSDAAAEKLKAKEAAAAADFMREDVFVFGDSVWNESVQSPESSCGGG